MIPTRIFSVLIVAGASALALSMAGGTFHAAETGEPMMYLTVKDYEAGVSYRDLQHHAPIGIIVNPCSYAEAETVQPTIDWNDGKGPHKPDTNYVTTMFQKTMPVIQGGVYLFWEDSHVAPPPGTSTVITKLTIHCVGDPPGDRVFETKNIIHSYARVPVKSVEFLLNGGPVSKVKGHDLVDVKVVLESPSPASGTWVKLTETPQSALNSLPPFYFISPGETEATIKALETRKTTADTNLVVTGSTVDPSKKSQTIIVTP
jgi:hypothetical protein